MKKIRIILQTFLVLAHLCTVLVLLASMGYLEPLVSSSQVEFLYSYAPSLTYTMMLVVLGAFSKYPWLAFAAMSIPAFSLIGCLLRGKTRWGYRILVYPALYLSMDMLFSFSNITVPGVLAVAYFAIALIVDLLP
ncbi:MAG: hypothetical protein J6K85_01315 [Clostridia bacterium]|nr:hypothetical protein [Clostridia bacterium]